MSIVSLNQEFKRIELSKTLCIDNEIVFNYFDRIPSEQRDETLFRALYIGVLALMEDLFSAFLANTSNELGTQLENLKIIFDMKKEIFYKTAQQKGTIAESEIEKSLNKYLEQRKIKDEVTLTGNTTGTLSRNKTGDIVCKLDGSDKKIVIECKFNKSTALGDIDTKDILKKKQDTAWNQLLEASVNRDAQAAIIVFDRELANTTILNFTDSVGFIPGVGFVVIVESQKNDYSNLFIAYSLARDIAMHSKNVDYKDEMLALLVRRILSDIKQLFDIKTLVEKNIKNNKSILEKMEQSMLKISFTNEYLKKFLEEGKMTKEDLYAFFEGDEVREKYKQIQQEINAFCDDEIKSL